MIKSIETYYKGYLCRSRTEARWMVAFDEAGIKYEYEPEGFDLDKVGKYLPDFYLPQVDMYAEVKGKQFTLQELKKARALSDYEEKCVLLLDGAPARKGYWAICYYNCWGAYETEYEDETFNILDFDIFEGHEYWLHESRFFAGTGTGMESFPLSHSNGHSDESDSAAVRKSRSARFEHYRK
tara:strand:- start:44 stop:589 length:546 start_codon:yes stop_codon:yes gene_type:complete